MGPGQDFMFKDWSEAASHAQRLFDAGHIGWDDFSKIMARAAAEGKSVRAPSPNAIRTPAAGLVKTPMDSNSAAPLAGPGGPEGLSLPNMNFALDNSRGPLRAQGDISTPFAGGDIGLSGAYSRAGNGPPDWSALLGYKRAF